MEKRLSHNHPGQPPGPPPGPAARARGGERLQQKEIKMGDVIKDAIKEISKFNPKFRQELNQHLVEKNPKLPRAEITILSHVIFNVPQSSKQIKKATIIILKAMQTIRPYSIKFASIDPMTNKEIPEKNPEIRRWDWQTIAFDRFRYLRWVGRDQPIDPK